MEGRKIAKTMITITVPSHWDYKQQYSLRARIGINILRLLQVVHLEFENS